MGFGIVIGFIEPLQIVTASNYSAVANSHTLQFTTALALRADSPPTRSRRSICSGGESSSTPTSVAGNAVHAFSKGNNFLRRLLSLHQSLSDNGLNVGRSSSYEFQNSPRPQLPASNSNGSQRLSCSSLPTHSLTHQPIRCASLNSSALHSQIFLHVTSRHGPHRKHWFEASPLALVMNLLHSNGLCHYLATILYRLMTLEVVKFVCLASPISLRSV
jgi:hypothetical protein